MSLVLPTSRSCILQSLFSKAVIGTWFATPRLLRMLHTVGPGVLCSALLWRQTSMSKHSDVLPADGDGAASS